MQVHFYQLQDFIIHSYYHKLYGLQTTDIDMGQVV